MELKRHQRLTAIYTMLERMQQAELRLAQAAVARVMTQTKLMEGELRASAAQSSAGGVDMGVERAAAGATFRYASGVLVGLGVAFDEAESVRVAAAAAYAESRLQLEQMKVIEAEARRAEQVESDRRAQMEVDDRFGGRRWAKVQGERR